MSLSSAAFTTLPDGFTDRSNARHRPPGRHSSVQGCASKRPFLAPNAGGAIQRMKPDMTWQTRGKDRRNPHPPRHFDPRCAAQAQVGHARKATVMLPTGPTAPPFPSPSWPCLIAQSAGLFMAVTVSRQPPANAGKSAMGWKPAGPKPRSGFGSRQPGARGSYPRGRHILGHLLHPVMISAISASLMCSAGLICRKIHK